MKKLVLLLLMATGICMACSNDSVDKQNEPNNNIINSNETKQNKDKNDSQNDESIEEVVPNEKEEAINRSYKDVTIKELIDSSNKKVFYSINYHPNFGSREVTIDDVVHYDDEQFSLIGAIKSNSNTSTGDLEIGEIILSENGKVTTVSREALKMNESYTLKNFLDYPEEEVFDKAIKIQQNYLHERNSRSEIENIKLIFKPYEQYLFINKEGAIESKYLFPRCDWRGAFGEDEQLECDINNSDREIFTTAMKDGSVVSGVQNESFSPIKYNNKYIGGIGNHVGRGNFSDFIITELSEGTKLIIDKDESNYIQKANYKDSSRGKYEEEEEKSNELDNL